MCFCFTVSCYISATYFLQRVYSSHGLVTTVAYQLGPKSPPVYALEGSVAVAGAAIKWLRDNMKLIKDVHESEHLAQSVFSTGDVYFVPAFTGLYAPYWRKDARGLVEFYINNFIKIDYISRVFLSFCKYKRYQTKIICEDIRKKYNF